MGSPTQKVAVKTFNVHDAKTRLSQLITAAEQDEQVIIARKDPMDRMLIGTAVQANLNVITADAAFAKYGVQTVW